MKNLLLFLLTLLSLTSLAQSGSEALPLPDSLAVKLESCKNNDLAKAEALVQVIKYFHINRHYIESRPYVEELCRLSDRLDDAYTKARADLTMGILIGETENRPNDALKYVHSAYVLASQLPENERSLDLRVMTCLNLGICYTRFGWNAEGYEYYIKGLELNEKTQNKQNEYILKINLLNVYNAMKKYDEAIAIGRELLNDKEYVYDKYIPYQLIANNYRGKEVFDTAIMYNDSAFIYAASPHDQSRYYTSVGLTLISMGDLEKAANSLRTSLYKYYDVNASETEIIDLIYLGYIYGLQSKQDSALFFMTQGIEKARKENLPSLELDGLLCKLELLYESHKTDETFQDMNRYLYLTDSLQKTNDATRLESLWLQQDFKQKETQLEYERQISEMSYRKQIILLFFISLVLVLVVLIMVLLLNRKKMLLKNKDIQLQNEALVKDSMAKELDLRNREMIAKTLVQVQRQEWVTEMIQKLKTATDDKKALSTNVREIIRNLEQYKNNSNPDDFDYYFTKTNPDFYNRLRADFPNLTSNELRLCAYLKMNLNTKDIATICNITPESARVARSRLRKSLDLVDSTIDLASFLSKY